MSARKDALRDRLWQHLVVAGRANREFGDAVQTLGIFRLMDIVDLFVDEVIAEQDAFEPLLPRLAAAEDRVVELERAVAEHTAALGALLPQKDRKPE